MILPACGATSSNSNAPPRPESTAPKLQSSVANADAPPSTAPEPDAGRTIAPEPAPLPSLTDPVRCTINEHDSFTYELTSFGSKFGNRLYVDGMASVAYSSARTALITVENRRPDGTGYILRGDYSGRFIYLKPGAGLSGAIVPSSEMPIHIHEMGDQILIRSGASKWFERQKPPSPTQTFPEYEPYIPEPMQVPCDALALHSHPETDVSQSKLALIEGSLPIRSTADGEITAWYRPDRDALSTLTAEQPAHPKPRYLGPPADIVERKGRRIRVRFNSAGYRVDGWLDASAVRPRTAPFRFPPSTVTPPLPVNSFLDAPTTRCKTEIPLYGPTGRIATYERMGSLLAGTPMRLGPSSYVSDGLRPIAIDGVVPEYQYKDGELRVRELDLQECTTASR